MSVIEALIFDLDGVLVNTVNLHFRAWANLAQKHNIPFGEVDMARFRGRQRQDCLRDLFDGRDLTETEIAAYLEIKDHYYLDLLDQTAPEELLALHAAQFIQAAQERRLKLGVASSSANALAVLHYVGLYDSIHAIADGTTVAHSKPAPDIFIWTAGALGVSPTRCLVFEDSRAGIAAARRAGMFAVGIGSQDFMDQAHLILPDLNAMPIDEILAAAAQHLTRPANLLAQ